MTWCPQNEPNCTDLHIYFPNFPGGNTPWLSNWGGVDPLTPLRQAPTVPLFRSFRSCCSIGPDSVTPSFPTPPLELVISKNVTFCRRGDTCRMEIRRCYCAYGDKVGGAPHTLGKSSAEWLSVVGGERIAPWLLNYVERRQTADVRSLHGSFLRSLARDNQVLSRRESTRRMFLDFG